LKYEKQNCIHCGREFAKNDDIVVCPVCGTPHHRECWADGSGCMNSFRHCEGYVYRNPNVAQENEGVEKCAFCGKENPETALFCHHCGADLTKDANQGGAQTNMPPFISFDFTPPKNPYENSDERIDDVPVSQIANQVLVKSEYYIPKFKKISKRKIPVSWNWASCIMPGCVWFYFRRCYLVGTLAGIFQLAVYFLFSGFFTNLWELTANSYTDEQAMAELMNLIASPTGIAVMCIFLGFHILMGLSGNAFYKAQIMKDIRKNKEGEKIVPGGTNIFAPVLGYFVFDSLTSIIINMFG